MNILQQKTKWDRSGESFRAVSIISKADGADIAEHFRYRCHHEHDCCGCVASLITSIRPLSNDRIAVRTYGWRNI